VDAGLWHWTSGTPFLFGIPAEDYLSWYLGSAIVMTLYAALDDGEQAGGDLAPIVAYAAVAASYLATRVGFATLGLMGSGVVIALARRAAPRGTIKWRAAWSDPPPADAVRALRREMFYSHPVRNHFVNSLHIVVAHGEKYMIANIRRVRES